MAAAHPVGTAGVPVASAAIGTTHGVALDQSVPDFTLADLAKYNPWLVNLQQQELEFAGLSMQELANGVVLNTNAFVNVGALNDDMNINVGNRNWTTEPTSPNDLGIPMFAGKTGFTSIGQAGMGGGQLATLIAIQVFMVFARYYGNQVRALKARIDACNTLLSAFVADSTPALQAEIMSKIGNFGSSSLSELMEGRFKVPQPDGTPDWLGEVLAPGCFLDGSTVRFALSEMVPKDRNGDYVVLAKMLEAFIYHDSVDGGVHKIFRELMGIPQPGGF